MRHRTHIAALLLAYCTTVVVSPLPVRAADAAVQANIEYEVKAAFLYNFAKFVEWPSTAFLAENAPLVFCVVGSNPFDDRLERVVNDRTANGRRIEIRANTPLSELGGCHLVFVPEKEEGSVAHLLQPLTAPDEKPVLTVGESEKFAEAGGMIRLLVDEGRVRFDINEGIAERNGLKLSSQLLKLARRVEK